MRPREDDAYQRAYQHETDALREQERADAVAADRARQASAAANADAEHERTVRLLEESARAHPVAPDVGTPPVEVTTLCERNGGSYSTNGACTVGRYVMFAVRYDASGLTDMVDENFVGADLDPVVGEATRLYGRYSGVLVNDEGFRAFWWMVGRLRNDPIGRGRGLVLVVSMTRSGVRMRFLAAPAEQPTPVQIQEWNAI